MPAQDEAGKATEEQRSSREKTKRAQSVAERLARVHSKASLKKGEHLEDLVMYRNVTQQKQVIEDDMGMRITLLPASYTDKSQRLFEEGKIDADERQKFEGGTIILTRRRATALVVTNVLEEVKLIDKAKPEDYD